MITLLNTNQITQAVQGATIIRDHVQTNWPAVCAVALWLRTELRNVAEYVIGHGGLVMICKKIVWNSSLAAGDRNPLQK